MFGVRLSSLTDRKYISENPAVDALEHRVQVARGLVGPAMLTIRLGLFFFRPIRFAIRAIARLPKALALVALKLI